MTVRILNCHWTNCQSDVDNLSIFIFFPFGLYMWTKIQEQGENNDTGKSKDIEGLCEEKIHCHQSMIWHFTVEKSLIHTHAHN